MKIGIISNVPRTGKTTLMLALGHAYSRSQQSKVAIFSTGQLNHVVEQLLRVQEKDEAATAGVFRAMLETGIIRGEDLFDYAIRSGRDEVYIFDLFNRGGDIKRDSLDFLVETVKSIQAKMTLVEIKGNPKEEGNQKMIDSCDVILNVFNLDNQSISEAKAYDKSLTDIQRKRTMVYICSMYDPRVVSEKKLSGIFGKGQKDIMTFENNPSLEKLFIDGDYDVYADRLVSGHEDLIKTRSEMLRLMQFMYDDGKRKRIKEIKDWK